ncbi:YihY/virulence factor BrkB family protein [Mycoplasma zalophidermidis]|uniref:YihY/virulence factor BrkB family protein n=1 Tax=Mycoplasma zalophidermidis TaxID=398174 RepID=A0ABS6DQW0_9MOLU|nr:YihY/virulence factor BrkB family protein [Mycoplasma zalophidermidis]MBU4689510.1 YihY/virulence factor BrkB family protein [Mycoplasma zalophidermidis]MBU4693388.1 YihY/virulence factor BrkB family protein [Mycoplasma zalophidermidis]MCR8966314.1 YihY/virulence factor BrkB family protein [Mycoplasma zalophidermidis]
MSNNEEQIYTGQNPKKIKKAYNKKIKKSVINKSVIPNENKQWWLLEKIIKFFIMLILWIATPKTTWKNKSKTKELIDRTYNRFTAKDLTFIPISLSFYFLVSFVPILTVVIVLLSFIQDYNNVFLNVILVRIIPGVENLINVPNLNINHGVQYTTIAILLLTSTWLGSNGWGRFIYSQNYIYGHETLGNFFINRIKGFFIVVSISIYLFLVTAFYIFIYKLISTNLNSVGEKIFFYVSFDIYLMIVLYFGFTLIYKLTPSFKLSWNSVLPGVLIASFPNMLFIGAFGYLTSLIKYNQYGAIGTFMYIALFVSSLSYFIFLGLIVNESYYKTYHSSYTIAKREWLFKKIK